MPIATFSGDSVARHGHTHIMPVPLDEMRALIARHAGAGSGGASVLPGIVLGKETAPTLPCPEIVGPMLSLVAQGSKRMTTGNRDLSYDAGQYAILPVDMVLDAHVVSASSAEPFLGFGLVLRPEPIAELLLAVGKQFPARDVECGVLIGEADVDLVDVIVRLLRLMDRPTDIPILASGIQRELLWRLISGPGGKLVGQVGVADSHVASVGRATRWLREHLAEPIWIEQIAVVAGMSATSLHRHFRVITSLSPIQYQKRLRLQAARTLLMAGEHGIAEAGFAVGYDNPSQFSREYRRMFGSPPGRDAARLRYGAVRKE